MSEGFHEKVDSVKTTKPASGTAENISMTEVPKGSQQQTENGKTQDGSRGHHRHYKLAVVLVYVLLLAVTIALCITILKTKDLQLRNKNLTEEKDQLQVQYNNIKEEKYRLQLQYRNLSEERDQLQLQLQYNTTADQLQLQYKNLTEEKDQLQLQYNNIKEEKDQLQLQCHNITEEKDQLQLKYKNFAEEKYQLQLQCKDITEKKDQLQLQYKNITSEKEELEERHAILALHESQLKTNFSAVTAERDQLQKRLGEIGLKTKELQLQYKNLAEEKKQLQLQCNNIIAEKAQLEKRNAILIHHKSQLETKFSAMAAMRNELQRRLSELESHDMKNIKQHAVDVTLDPDTANPYLILSAYGKQVKHGDTRQNLPDTPKRFIKYADVLGSEGFSSGKFYYEVQVKGKTGWEIGVAKESINRKGEIKASPEYGLWIIWLRDGTYKALAGPSVPLSLKGELQSVGVFVDYDAGLVSFYEADCWNHIYSFTSVRFTEKIYPFFNPNSKDGGKNSDPLIISPVHVCPIK